MYKVQNIFIKSDIELNYEKVDKTMSIDDYNAQFKVLFHSDRIKFATDYNEGNTPNNELYLYHEDIMYDIFMKLFNEYPHVIESEYYDGNCFDGDSTFSEIDWTDMCTDDMILNQRDKYTVEINMSHDDSYMNCKVRNLNKSIVDKLNLIVDNFNYTHTFDDNKFPSKFPKEITRLFKLPKWNELYPDDDVWEFIKKYVYGDIRWNALVDTNFNYNYQIFKNLINSDDGEEHFNRKYDLEEIKDIVNSFGELEAMILIADYLGIVISDYKFDIDDVIRKVDEINEYRREIDKSSKRDFYEMFTIYPNNVNNNEHVENDGKCVENESVNNNCEHVDDCYERQLIIAKPIYSKSCKTFDKQFNVIDDYSWYQTLCEEDLDDFNKSLLSTLVYIPNKYCSKLHANTFKYTVNEYYYYPYKQIEYAVENKYLPSIVVESSKLFKSMNANEIYEFEPKICCEDLRIIETPEEFAVLIHNLINYLVLEIENEYTETVFKDLKYLQCDEVLDIVECISGRLC